MIDTERRPASISGDGHQPLLEVRNLVKYFPIKGGFLQRTVANVKAVDGVSFEIMPGETFGLIGESGSRRLPGARPSRL